jgi:ubiquinol-cytochrome c reductase subunit 7
MSSLTLVKKQAELVLKTPLLRQLALPAAKVFTYLSGYRQLGLKLDDLLIEENPAMQKAISRLPVEESYARNFRIITAHQLFLSADVLPESKSIKASEDVPYLTPYVLEAEAELAEKAALNNSVVAN